MPLTAVSPGQEVTLIDIQGGRGTLNKSYLSTTFYPLSVRFMCRKGKGDPPAMD